jgi:hypothetical protein
MKKRNWANEAVGAVLVMWSLFSGQTVSADGEKADEKTTLTDISGITPIQEAFNADKGLPRMLILLAPT